jgi:hypothetical protein
MRPRQSKQTPEAIIESVRLFEQDSAYFDPAACRKNASRFSIERFCREFLDFCEEAVAKHKGDSQASSDTASLSDAVAKA